MSPDPLNIRENYLPVWSVRICGTQNSGRSWTSTSSWTSLHHRSVFSWINDSRRRIFTTLSWWRHMYFLYFRAPRVLTRRGFQSECQMGYRSLRLMHCMMYLWITTNLFLHLYIGLITHLWAFYIWRHDLKGQLSRMLYQQEEGRIIPKSHDFITKGLSSENIIFHS